MYVINIFHEQNYFFSCNYFRLLPLVAYNVTSGPWRTLWVRFGYDPRTSPEGKMYGLTIHFHHLNEQLK